MLKLLRHGEAVGNAEGRLLGRMNSPLSDHGRAQAVRLKEILGDTTGVTRVISSPLSRARATAEALDIGVPVDVDERWTEVDYGDFDGDRLSDVPSYVWTSWRSDPGYRPPGGETLDEMQTRVRQACEELFAEAGAGARSGDVIVVSHVSPIKAAVGWALGVGDSVAWRLWLATASLTVIGWGSDTPVLHRYNVVVGDDAHTGASTARVGSRASGSDR